MSRTSAIELAILKGGFKGGRWEEFWHWNEHRNRGQMVLQHNDDWDDFWTIDEMLNDPAFWEALGKALGWDLAEHGRYGKLPGFIWVTEWHRYIDHLIDDQSPDDFFKALLAERRDV